jgi:hypothetical protein
MGCSVFDGAWVEQNMRYENELLGVMAQTSDRRKAFMKRRRTIRAYVAGVFVAALLVLLAGVALMLSR